MRIGIAFGGYCPLHQGHMDTIMRAKRENDRCFVFVCGYENDRGGEILPMNKRFRIISNFLTDGVTKVGLISDTQLGLDESMSTANWGIWCNEAYYQLGAMGYNLSDDEFHWYVGEDSYVPQIRRVTPEWIHCYVHLVDREENHVSGTLCRTQPLKYWNKITAPFRAYYSHNILIAGTASEGKTTLCQDLGRYFNLPFSYEKGRDICKLKTDPEFTVKDFIYNIYEQHKYNEELISSPQNPGVFVSDTDNMVTLMYAKAYSEREDFGINSSDYQLLYNMAKAYAPTDKWDKVFLLAPHLRDIVDDGERYMPDSDFGIRMKFFNELCQLYDDFGIEYEILHGDYYQNFCKVRDYIKGLYE